MKDIHEAVWLHLRGEYRATWRHMRDMLKTQCIQAKDNPLFPRKINEYSGSINPKFLRE
jgi:hypothetical protein